MITYWVCPKGKRDKYGEIVDNFKSMMHYYFLFSDCDDKAEIYVSGSRNDINVADKFLEIFNKYDLNLTKIESRPAKTVLGEYIFLIDVSIENVQEENAMNEIKEKGIFVRILGKY